MLRTICVGLLFFSFQAAGQNFRISIPSSLLYVHIPNSISLSLDTSECTGIFLQMKGAEIRSVGKSDGCFSIDFVVTPKEIGPNSISVYRVQNGDTIKLGNRAVNVVNIEYSAMFNGLKGGEINKDSLANKKLIATRSDHGNIVLCGVNPGIRSYTVIIYRNEECIYIDHQKGNQMSVHLVNFAKKELRKGDRLVLCNLKSHGISGVEVFHPLEFEIR